MSGGRTALLGVMLVAAGGCDRLVTAHDQLVLDTPNLRAGTWEGLSSDSPVLAGTRICPTLRCAGPCGDDEPDVSDCYVSQVVAGGSLDDDGCIVAEGPEDLEWRFVRVACSLDDEGFEGVDDTLQLAVVAPEDVRAVIEWWPERWARRRLAIEGARPDVPDPGQAMRAVAEGELTLSTILVHEDFDAPVIFDVDEARVSVEGQRGRPPVWFPAQPGVVRFLGFADTESRLVFEHPALGREVVSGLEVIDRGRVEQLELAVAVGTDDGVPQGARAVVRDGQGRPVFGAPVVWGLESGSLQVTPRDDLIGFDYVRLGGNCEPPPPTGEAVERAATLRASLGDRSVTHTFVWTETGDDREAAAWSKPGACLGPEDGCACSTARRSGATSTAGVLGLGLLVAASRVGRRRRRGAA